MIEARESGSVMKGEKNTWTSMQKGKDQVVQAFSGYWGGG